MASIKLRKATWYAVWWQNGRQIMKTTNIKAKGAKEKKLAQITADTMEQTSKGEISVNGALDALRQISAAMGFSSKMPTVREYLEDYEPGGNRTNKIGAKRVFTLFCEHLGVDAFKRLDLVTPAMCKSFFQERLKLVSYGTVQRHRDHLSAAFNNAVKEGLLQRSPLIAVTLSKLIPEGAVRSVKREPFTPEEMNTIVSTFPAPWPDIVLTSYLTGGQRLGDTVLLKWSNVDFENKVINIKTMKTGKQITAPLHPLLEQTLLRLKKSDEEYVFPAYAQKYQRSNGYISSEFISLLRNAGIVKQEQKTMTGDRKNISPKSFHSIRHTVVTQMRCNPLISADLVREIVGHDSEEVERGYFTAPSQAKLDAISFLANKIAPASETPAEA